MSNEQSQREPAATVPRLTDMRQFTSILAAAGVALVVAGCGSAGSTGSAGSAATLSPRGQVSGSPDPLQPADSRPLGTVRVTPLSQAATEPPAAGPLQSVPWRYTGSSDGGRVIGVALEYGGCTTFSHAVVRQTSAAVEIQTYTSTRRLSSTAVCPDLARVLHGSVTLDAALGSRELLHGPTVSMSH